MLIGVLDFCGIFGVLWDIYYWFILNFWGVWDFGVGWDGIGFYGLDGVCGMGWGLGLGFVGGWGFRSCILYWGWKIF